MSNSLFTIHHFDIQVNETGKPIYLIPFGDIHRFAPLCNVDRWLEFLEWAKKKDRCYFLGMGDYDDLASTKERHVLASVDLHESTHKSLDEYYAERTKKLIDEIRFMKGRLIGLIEGNHYAQFETSSKISDPLSYVQSTTTTQMMCKYLNTKYLGVSSFIRVNIRLRDSSKYACVDIWAHHGKGASRLVGGSLNTVQQMVESAEADIYLMGHDHKKSLGTKSRLLLTKSGRGQFLTHKKILFGRTGAFLKGYEPEEDSYIAKGAMSPTDFGVLKIELTPKRDCRFARDLFYIDIHGSL